MRSDKKITKSINESIDYFSINKELKIGGYSATESALFQILAHLNAQTQLLMDCRKLLIDIRHNLTGSMAKRGGDPFLKDDDEK